MYLSLEQHDLFRNLLMSFEIPFRLFVADVVLNKYTTYEDFENALTILKNNVSSSDHIFLRNNLPKACASGNCRDIYERLVTANNNRFADVIVTDQEMPTVGNLNIVTFALKSDFPELYLLCSGYMGYCTLAEKYRYARNKLDHPGCKTLEDSDLVPVLSFVKDITNFLDESYFSQKSKGKILEEVSALHNRKIEIPVHVHNFPDMPYTESKIVGRENEIERLKKFICGNPSDLRKQHSCCIFGYGGVGKTALVLEVVKRIIQDIWDGKSLNDYKPEYILFFSAKKNKLEIDTANGKIIDRTIKRQFENADELKEIIFDALELTDFKNYHQTGIIIVDNLESLQEDERQKIKHFIEIQTPSEMQFLITSRNSEEYEMNYRLSGFEHDGGVDFVNQYVIENGLDLELASSDIEELLLLSKGNTLVLVLCLRRLSQRLSDISGLQSEFSSVNAWKDIRNSLKNYPGNAYEVISEFMFKDTFEEIEKVFSEDCDLFYKILKIFAVYQNNSVDLNTVCILSKESYPRVEAVADTLCNYLILEKSGELYSLNDFAEKYIVNRFMPDATTYSVLSAEIRQRETQVQQELKKLDSDIKIRSELAQILRDWCIVSDSDRITAARMYRLYGEANQECKKDSRFFAQSVLEDVIRESKEAEGITAHPYIKFQKSRILQLIDRSKILSETHTEEIIEGFRSAIFVIKTVEQFSPIQNTKSYASLLWLFGQYLTDINRKEEAIRYLEEGIESFDAMNITDKEYYQCLSKLGSVYLDYFEENSSERMKYLDLARSVNKKLQRSFKKLGDSKNFARLLRQRIEKYNKISG